MSLAIVSPASVVVPEEGVEAERDHALRRDAAARIATSLVRFAAARRQRAADAADLVVVDHIATHEASYHIRGELLTQAPDAPVVLVAIEREPDIYPSYRELRAAFALTRAEARVATMLAERKSNSEIAQELGVTGATARRHTEHVLLKVGVGRRTAVCRALMDCTTRGGTALTRGFDPEERAGAADRPGEPVGSRGEHAAAVAFPRADGARQSDGEPRRGRPKKHTFRRHETKESVFVLLEREHERLALRDSLAGEVKVHFAEGPREVHPPWRNEVPIAVLVELHQEREHRIERALGILRREAPDIRRWAYAELDPAAVGVALRLTERGLVSEVITSGEDLGSRLRALLKRTRVWSESEALRRVWAESVGPVTCAVVEACIDASAGAATPRDLEHELDKSSRTLRRELSEHGLPSPARLLTFCRLLRAMYRLDHRGIKVKVVASELGYRYPSALSHQLHWFTGLAIARVPAGRRFATLASLVRGEISATRHQIEGSRDRDTASVERRQSKHAIHDGEMQETSASL